MRVATLLIMTATLSSTLTAASLAGVWRLVEVNSLPMQETPPYGQINRKEIYTDDGRLLVVRPDMPSSQAKPMGTYEVQEGVRVFTAPDGEKTATPIQWIDDDHFFFEFNPGECWWYARVKGKEAADEQWEPRSVAVIRTSALGTGPTLRDFTYDLTDDSAMRWEKRVFGAWETIKVAGRGVSGPDTPPYGMPNDRFLIGADGTMRKVHANGQADRHDETVHITVKGNMLTVVEANFEIPFWFNRWGQLVLEQGGTQTILKRISFDAAKAPAGPFVVVLLSSEREEPPQNGRIVEVKKSAVTVASSSVKASPSAPAAARPAARPKVTFTRPYNGNSFARDLALADDASSFEPKSAVYRQALKSGLGKPADVVEVDTDDKFAEVRSAALASTFEVPLGWHVTDDGKRTVVFDADQFVQVQLEVRPAKKGAKALLQKLLDEHRAAQPDLKAQLMDNADGSVVVILQNFKMGDDVVTRSYVSHPGHRESEIILAQITASPADLIRALNLNEALFRHIKPKQS